jgi:putative transposase
MTNKHDGMAHHVIQHAAALQVSAYVPLSHPFVERLIGTIRREYLDQTLFWTAADLEHKLQLFQDYFNRQRVDSGLGGGLPNPEEAATRLKLDSYRWQQHCRGLYQTPIAT